MSMLKNTAIFLLNVLRLNLKFPIAVFRLFFKFLLNFFYFYHF